MQLEGKVFISLRPILIGLLVLCVGGIIGSYVLYQVRFLAQGPMISVISDIPPIVVDNEVVVEGAARNIVSLTLNGRTIYTTDDGHFKETMYLPAGYTIIAIEGIDRYGKRTRVERNVVYRTVTTH